MVKAHSLKLNLKTFGIAFVFVCIFITQSHAASVTLQWDANTESTLKGYKIYYKTGTAGPPYDGSGAFQGDSPVTVPFTSLVDAAHPKFTLSFLNGDQSYRIAITAYSDTDESWYSKEALFQGDTLLYSGIAVDFGTNGLWRYDGSWSKMSNWNPDDDIAGWSGGLAVDFDDGGLWNHDGSSWSRISNLDTGSTGLTGWSGGLAVDFDGSGLWNFDGSAWTKISNWDVDVDLAGWSGGLAVGLKGKGLWSFDGSSWSRITTWNVGSAGLAGWSGGLAVDFGVYGLWIFNGSTWRNLSNWTEENLTGWPGGLAVDFGANGLWSYNGSSWTKLSTWNPSVMVGFADGLAVDFDANGMWKYDGFSWTKISRWNPENMADCDLN